MGTNLCLNRQLTYCYYLVSFQDVLINRLLDFESWSVSVQASSVDLSFGSLVRMDDFIGAWTLLWFLGC